MGDDVRIRFTKSGDREVQAVFRSIAAAAGQLQNAQRGVASAAKSAGRQTAAAWSAAGRPMSATEKLAMRVAASQERAARKAANTQIRESNRAYQAEVRNQLALIRIQRRSQYNRELAERRHANRVRRIREGRQSTLGLSIRSGTERLGGGIASSVGRGIIGGIAGLTLAGTAAVGLGIRGGVQLNDTSRRLARKGGGGVTGAQLRREFEQQAVATPGVKAADLAAASERFVGKTGDLDAARRFNKVFAEISLATGTAAEDIGDAAADLFEKFDIKSMRDMGDALAVLAVQGKRGSFELEDAAKQFPRLAAEARVFGLRGAKGLATLGGLTQIVRTATGSPEQATTAIEGLFQQLQSNSKQIKRKTGVSVFTDASKTRARDIQQLIPEIIAGAKGNVETLRGLFAKRSFAGIAPSLGTFNKVYQGTQGTEQERLAAATKAVRDELEKFTDATGAAEEIQRDLADAQKDTGAQWTAVWESFKAGLGERVVPQVTEGLARLAAWINRTDFSAFESGLVVATQALGAFISFLESIGLFKRKRVGSAEGKAQTAELAASASESAIQASGLRAKRGDLQTEIATGRDTVTGAKLSKGEIASRQNELAGVQTEETRAQVVASLGRIVVTGRRGVEQIETLGGTGQRSLGARYGYEAQNVAATGIGSKTGQAGGTFEAAFQRVSNQIEGKGTEASKGIAAAGNALAQALEEVAANIRASGGASVFSPT